MKRTVGLVAAGLVLIVAGCGSTPPAVAPAVSSSVTVPAGKAAATTSPAGFLRPAPQQADVQAAAFIAIDPRMDNVDRYLTRSVDQCATMRGGEVTGAALTANVHKRFESGSMPSLTDDQVGQILKTISVWCTGASSVPAAAAPSSAADAGPVTADLEALAVKFGCAGYAVQPAAPLTTTYATCTLDGSQVQLYAFAAPAMSKAFLASVKGYGVTADQMVAGDGYLVAPKDVSQLAAIRAALQ